MKKEGPVFSRRNFLQLGLGALVLGASSTTYENEAAAELVCKDNYIPDP